MNTSSRTGERESEGNVRDSPKVNAEVEEVVHLDLKGERGNLLLRSNSRTSHLDRFIEKDHSISHYSYEIRTR
jgi:hypothetical protein